MPRQAETKVKGWLRDGFRRLFSPDASIMVPVEGGPGQSKGLPDRFFAAQGRSAWVEAKEGDYQPEKLQCRQMGRLATSGERVILLRGRIDNESVATHVVEPGLGSYLHLRSRSLEYHRAFLRSEISTEPFWDHILGAFNVVA